MTRDLDITEQMMAFLPGVVNKAAGLANMVRPEYIIPGNRLFWSPE